MVNRVAVLRSLHCPGCIPQLLGQSLNKRITICNFPINKVMNMECFLKDCELRKKEKKTMNSNNTRREIEMSRTKRKHVKKMADLF